MQKLCIQRFFPLALCVVLFLLGGNASAYGAMQPLPDINLSDTSSAAIPVEGDFRLNLQFYAESLGSDNHAALNFRVGNDVLTIAFAGHEGVGTFGTFARLNGEHSIKLRDGSTCFFSDGFHSTGANKRVDNCTVRVEFCRIGDTITLEAIRNTWLGTKRITSYSISLAQLAGDGTVYLSGSNLALSSVCCSVERLSGSSSAQEKPLMVEILLLLLALAVSVIAFLFVLRKFTPWVQDLLDVDFWLPAAIVAVALLAYGAVMVVSWFNFSAANHIVHSINQIFRYVASDLVLPLQGSLLANKFVVIAALAVGLGILILLCVSDSSAKVFPAALLCGALGLASGYALISFAVAGLSSVLNELLSVIAVALVFLFVCSAAEGSGDGSAPSASAPPQRLRMGSTVYYVSHSDENYLYIYPQNGDNREAFPVHKNGSGGAYTDSSGNDYFSF